MNKRIEKMVKNFEAGKITVRRDQLLKAVEEKAFDYMIVRAYDEVYDTEDVKCNATIENIGDHWLRGARIWSEVNGNTLKVVLAYGYSYKYLYCSLEEKKEEVTAVENIESVEVETVVNTEGIEVVYNEEKNGIEISFASKELATEEIRTELKAVGFRYFAKYRKWMARQNEETIATVNKLFGSAQEVEEIEVTEEVEEMLQEEENELINCDDFKDITTIKNVYCTNWNALPEELQEFILSCDRYWIYGSQELVLYKNNKGVASLGINVGIRNNRDIEIISAGAGELFQWNLYKGFTENNLVAVTTHEENFIIHIEGEGSIPEITTSSIIEATENLNARILKEYDSEFGGYVKTFITLSVNGEDHKFRYDIDNKMSLQENILEFMLDEEYNEYKYTLDNIEKFTWINKEKYIKDYEGLFEMLEGLIEENNIRLNITNNPYNEAIEKINDNELYEVSASHDWLLKDSRLIKNDCFNGVVVCTGKAIREFIREGKRIDVFNLQAVRNDIKAFTEGIIKCDSGQLVTLIPSKQDLELKNVKMLPRLEKELKRALV